MSLVEVRGLYKDYGDVRAVDDATFDIQEGEIFGLLGPNGAGKTTILSILSTYIKPPGGPMTV